MSSPASLPFLLLTPRLILIPTPWSINIPAFCAMYGTLHGLPEFCDMAFGPHLRAEHWSAEHTLQKMRDSNARCWDGPAGMGDMAVGVVPVGLAERWPVGRAITKLAAAGEGEIRLLEGEVAVSAVLADVDAVEWAGYVGVRDATTTSLLSAVSAAAPSLPPWEEMVELRYGMRPEAWGRGYAPEAARAAMAWAVEARGVRRFIAETEKLNERSGAVLRRMGFVEHVGKEGRNEWWGEESQTEWARIV